MRELEMRLRMREIVQRLDREAFRSPLEMFVLCPRTYAITRGFWIVENPGIAIAPVIPIFLRFHRFCAGADLVFACAPVGTVIPPEKDAK